MRLARMFLTKSGQPSEFMRRANKIAGDLNVVLVIFAMGLAMLDFTFLVTQKVIDSLPPATRMIDDPDSAPITPPVINLSKTPATNPSK